MADLVTRLLLNSSNFDNNIKKSSLQVLLFQNISRNISTTLGKFAGFLGVAMTAGEAFNKTIRSSQTLSDTFDSSMMALTNSVDLFFYALGSGEFQSFLNGLGNIIEKALEAYSAMDLLGNTRISFDYASAQNAQSILEALSIAKNKFAPIETRNEGFEKWLKAILTQIEQNETLKFDLQKAVTTAVEAEIGKENIKVTMEDVDKVLKIDITNPLKRELLKNQYSSQYDEYKDKIGDLGSYTYKDAAGNTNISFWKHYTDGEKKIMEDLALEYREAIIVNAMLNKYKDEELTALKDNAKQFVSLDAATYGLIREFNETANEYNNANKAVKGFQKIESFEGYTTYTPTTTTTTKTVKVLPVIPEGSLLELDKLIAAKKTELNLAINLDDRIKIYKELEALTDRKRVIEFQYKYPKAPAKLDLKPAGITDNLETKFTENLPTFDNPIKKQDINLTNDYVESLNAVANAMTAINNANVEGTAGWISWAGSLMTATATAIEAIKKVIAAKTAEAAASGAAEAAKTPVVGWLMVGGAIASILAAFSALPSFSTGGIFAGNSTIGDMNLARVNAGEMILNNRQLKNLFNLLNGNGSNDASGASVQFKIKGSELVGVLNNYNSRINKIR